MKPASFELHRAREVEEVLDLLALHGENAKLLAGGQSLVPLMNLRMVAPAVLIDINGVRGMSGIRTGDRHVSIGAMTRQGALLADDTIRRHVPLLALALGHVGHVQTRSRGSIGGSLAHADPAAELPLAMVALDAIFTVKSARGARDIRARGFFRDVLTTALAPDELLTEVHIPIAPSGTRASFREYARRHGDFAIAAAAAQRSSDDGSFVAAVGGVGAVPHLCAGVAGLAASDAAERGRLEELARREIQDIVALSDHHASGHYRRRLGAIALADCLEEILRS